MTSVAVVAGSDRLRELLESAGFEVAMLERLPARAGSYDVIVFDGSLERGRLVELVDRREPGPVALTSRERQVLTRIAAGRANYEIAAELHLTVRTIKYHVSNLLAKLGARDRAHAVAIGYGCTPDDAAST